jgi:glycosyltransferase involved in cell wall biosynthesis
MKASVLITTYNHQRWLSGAIDSVLKQKTDFDFEIVIGVDLSDDRTLETAEQYAKFHKNITVLMPYKRLGGRQNFFRTLQNCSGEYVAILDGDDFWNDESKLQDQIDFLESNSDFSCSVTQAAIEYHGRTDKRFETNYSRDQEIWHGKDVIKTPSFACHSSTVFRREALLPLPKWFYDIDWADSAIRGLLAKHGKFHYLQRKATTYRCNNWGALSELRKKGNSFMAKASRKIMGHITKQIGEFTTA